MRASQTRTVRSAEPVARRVPSGETATVQTRSGWPLSSKIISPESTSHNLAVPLSPPVKIREPSGVKATEKAFPVCALIVRIVSNVVASHRTTEPSLSPAAAHNGLATSAKVLGKPDFVFRRSQLALFVDGCFWNCCPKHSNMPANNKSFWRKKLGANKARDVFVNKELRKQGWRVVRIWEHALTKNPERCANRIRNALRSSHFPP